MKRLIITLLMLCGIAYGQVYTPMAQNYEFKRHVKIDSTLNMAQAYADTTAANTAGSGLVAGRLIRIGNDFWMRNTALTAWLQFVNTGPGSTSSDAVWETDGNYSPTDPTTFKLGHIDSFPLRFYTNNVKRLEIPANGIQSVNGSQYRYLVYDTSGVIVGYTSGLDTILVGRGIQKDSTGPGSSTIYLDSAYYTTVVHGDSTFGLRYNGDSTLFSVAGGGGGTPGIDDVLAQAQVLTASRSIDIGGGATVLQIYGNAFPNIVAEFNSDGALISSASGLHVYEANDSLYARTNHTSSDTSKYKPFGISPDGGAVRMNSWPVGAGGSTAIPNNEIAFGNGTGITSNSDFFYSTGSGGLFNVGFSGNVILQKTGNNYYFGDKDGINNQTYLHVNDGSKLVTVNADSLKLGSVKVALQATDSTGSPTNMIYQGTDGLLHKTAVPSGSGGTPAGNDGNIQIKSGSSFSTPAGDSLTWDAPNGILVVAGDLSVGNNFYYGVPTGEFDAYSSVSGVGFRSESTPQTTTIGDVTSAFNNTYVKVDDDNTVINLNAANGVTISNAFMPNNIAGTAGQKLTSAGAGSPPTWKDTVAHAVSTLTGLGTGVATALAVNTNAAGGMLTGSSSFSANVLTVLSDFRPTKTITAAGTTGAQTINKTTGSVNFAAGASTLVVTNSFAATTSVIIVTVYGADATATSARVTKATGSFTITLNAAATAETAVGFMVTN